MEWLKTLREKEKCFKCFKKALQGRLKSELCGKGLRKEKAFENIARKREIACNLYFLLFPIFIVLSKTETIILCYN